MPLGLTLTAEQQSVITAPDGPLLLFAGPGTGKTAVLAARIAHLISDRGIAPASVLALTFSNRAAGELRARLTLLLGDDGGAVDVATYHGFGLRVLRQWQTALGYRPGPLAVIAGPEALTLLATTTRDLGFTLGQVPLRALFGAVERYRMGAGDPVHAAALQTIVTAYERELRRRQAVDYPAMLLLPLRLLRHHPPVERLHRVAYRAVLVDEAQDTCPTQYALVRQLAAQHRHLFLVGDPAQSLFAWRGADNGVFHDFLRDFAEAHVYTLSQNFRSTPQIVAMANAIGAGLPLHVALRTSNASGPSPVLYPADGEQEEADFIATQVARLQTQGTVGNLGEIAVIVRANGQLKPVAAALQARGLPCHYMTPDAKRDCTDQPSPTGTLLHAPAGAAHSPATGAVSLLTVHAAKGLEWPVVFVAGLEEGTLPHSRTLREGAAAVAGERRVAYVALSRPQHRLYLSWRRTRVVGDQRIACRPSRFLADLADLPMARAS